jgi:hypothetical protein
VTTPAQLIALLNSLSFGDLDAIRAKLDEARTELEALGHGDVAALVVDARAALAGGDLKTYRKRVETAVAKLGHVR